MYESAPVYDDNARKMPHHPAMRIKENKNAHKNECENVENTFRNDERRSDDRGQKRTWTELHI